MIPNGNDFIEDVLNGQFEFPDAEEGGSYFLAAGREGNDIGDFREEVVAGLVGGTLAKDSKGQDIQLKAEGVSASVSIDVFGPSGELGIAQKQVSHLVLKNEMMKLN